MTDINTTEEAVKRALEVAAISVCCPGGKCKAGSGDNCAALDDNTTATVIAALFRALPDLEWGDPKTGRMQIMHARARESLAAAVERAARASV